MQTYSLYTVVICAFFFCAFIIFFKCEACMCAQCSGTLDKLGPVVTEWSTITQIILQYLFIKDLFLFKPGK